MYTSAWSDEGRAVAIMSAAALRQNVKEIRRCMGGEDTLCGVVKADAYGHGAVPVARILKEEKVAWLAVATADEAMELRSAGIDGPLLVLGVVPVSFAPTAATEQISLTVPDAHYGIRLKQEAEAAGVQVHVHVKLDTGLTRLGFATEPADLPQTLSEIKALFDSPALVPEGLFSHFASSESDPAFCQVQVDRFLRVMSGLTDLTFPIRHIANSGGCGQSGAPFNMCRVGLMLYGGQPDPGQPSCALRPVMSVFGRVVQTRTLSKTETVGYGRTAESPAGSRLAVVEIGYADGVPRALSGRGFLLVRGKRAPLVGRVSMDRVVIDIGDLPVLPGEQALYFGAADGETVTADEVADLADTISYELFCRIAKRVPRIWTD